MKIYVGHLRLAFARGMGTNRCFSGREKKGEKKRANNRMKTFVNVVTGIIDINRVRNKRPKGIFLKHFFFFLIYVNYCLICLLLRVLNVETEFQ